jgi:putative ABC transport system substrate-binding protein
VKASGKPLAAGFVSIVLSLGAMAIAEAQAPIRIGASVSQTGAYALQSTHMEAFRQGLRERGYVEGRNIVIEYRYGDGKLDRLPQFAAELVGLNVDVIVTSGTPPTRAAQQATRTIPIVMTVVGDPIAGGFIASLAKPGGNITGLTQISTDLSGKRLQLLKESFPKVSRVAVLVDPAASVQRVSGAALQQTQMAAETLGVKLLSLELQGPNLDLEGAFRTATRERVGALLVVSGPALALHMKRVVDLAAKSRLPAMYFSSEFIVWPEEIAPGTPRFPTPPWSQRP